MEVLGGCGRSARWYGDERAVIAGLETSGNEPAETPDDDGESKVFFPGLEYNNVDEALEARRTK